MSQYLENSEGKCGPQSALFWGQLLVRPCPAHPILFFLQQASMEHWGTGGPRLDMGADTQIIKLKTLTPF